MERSSAPADLATLLGDAEAQGAMAEHELAALERACTALLAALEARLLSHARETHPFREALARTVELLARAGDKVRPLAGRVVRRWLASVVRLHGGCEVVQAMRLAKEVGVAIDTEAVMCVLRACRGSASARLIDAVYRDFVVGGPADDRDVLSELVWTACMAGDARSACDVVRDAEARHVVLREFAYSAVLAEASDIELVATVLEAIQEHGVSVGREVQETAIRALCDGDGSLEAAKHAVERMRHAQLKLSRGTVIAVAALIAKTTKSVASACEWYTECGVRPSDAERFQLARNSVVR